MRTLWICCAFIFLAVTTDAKPSGGEKFWDVMSATRQRRTDGSGGSSCQNASHVLGQIIQLGQDTTQYGKVLQYLNVFVNFDALDAAEREEFICQFSDLNTLGEFISIAQQNGILDHLARRGYNFVTVWAMVMKPRLLEIMEDYEYDWADTVQMSMLDLINSLESTGFLQHDPEGTQVFLEMIRGVFEEEFGEGYIAEPLSDEPFLTQVIELTNALRKLWNLHVKKMSVWDPDYGQKLRQGIKEWTGIKVNQGYMKAFVATILESAEHGLLGITQVVQLHGTIFHVVKKGYPLLMDLIDQTELEDAENYGYVYDIYGSEDYMASHAILVQIAETLPLLFNSLREMGLFNLEDDL